MTAEVFIMQLGPLSPDDLLLTAVKKGNNEAVLQALQKGAALEVKNDEGRTPLMLAARNGQTAIVETLLQHGAAIEARDNFYWTPLMHAVLKGQSAMVERLLQCRANIAAKDIADYTPLMITTLSNKPDATVEILALARATYNPAWLLKQSPLIQQRIIASEIFAHRVHGLGDIVAIISAKINADEPSLYGLPSFLIVQYIQPTRENIANDHSIVESLEKYSPLLINRGKNARGVKRKHDDDDASPKNKTKPSLC
jgi:hypothetical protein